MAPASPPGAYSNAHTPPPPPPCPHHPRIPLHPPPPPHPHLVHPPPEPPSPALHRRLTGHTRNRAGALGFRFFFGPSFSPPRALRRASPPHSRPPPTPPHIPPPRGP